MSEQQTDFPKPAAIVAIGFNCRNVVLLVACVLLAFGIYALVKMDKNEFPDFTIREGVVAAIYPGADVNEIERNVLKPLEDYVFSFSEVNKRKTHATITDGRCLIFVELDDNIDDATPFWNKFKLGTQQVRLKLPAGVVAVETLSDFGDTASLLITIESRDKTYRELSDYVDDLTSRLRTVEAVSSLNVYGKQEEQIAVYLDPQKLSKYAINEKMLAIELFAKGFQTTGGELRCNSYIQPIYVTHAVNSVFDLRNMIVAATPDGSIIRLSDIADVRKEYPVPTSYITNNGTKCILLGIQMKPGNNIVEMGKEVNQVLADFEAELPDDVRLFKITDQPTVVNSSVTEFLSELCIAVVAVIVVIILLLPLKVALIAAATIPIATFISLGIFYSFGIELNTVTLACLILSLGMIVDNSVVIIDNYVELLSEGVERKTATLRAGTEFLKAIFSATLAISITFFPFLLTMTGMFRDFLTDFPWALTIVLMVSLIVAEMLVPFLQYKFIKEPTKGSSIFRYIQTGYNRLLALCVNHRIATIVVSVIAVALGFVMFLTRPFQLMPIAERNQFAVEIFMPTGTAVARTSEVADSLEHILAADNRVVSIASFHGCASPRFQATYAPQIGGENFAQFIVNTRSDQTTIDVLNDYADKYAQYFPDAIVRFKQMSYSTADFPIEIRIAGQNRNQLKAFADSVAKVMRCVPGLTCVRTSLGNPQIAAMVTPNQTVASRAGLTNTAIETTLALRYSSGLPIATMQEGEHSLSVVLKTPTSNLSNINDLQSEPLPIPGNIGNVVLRSLATTTPQWNDGTLSRRNGIPTVSVIAETERNINVIDRTEAVMDSLSLLSVPDGITVSRGGEWENSMSILPQILEALAIAVVIMFFIILFHYRKIDISLLLLVSLLLCIPGAGAGMLIQGTQLSLTCVLGIVSLMGILVRNAIVLLDYAEELRSQGQTPREAIINAAKRRMRPIFLTSAAATMGVVPMVINGSALWKPMGVVIFYGTPITMIFILTTLPVGYMIINSQKYDQK